VQEGLNSGEETWPAFSFLSFFFRRTRGEPNVLWTEGRVNSTISYGTDDTRQYAEFLSTPPCQRKSTAWFDPTVD